MLPQNGEWDLILLAFMPNVIVNQDGAEKGIRRAQPPELRAFQQPTTASHQQESFEPVEIDLGLIERYPLLAGSRR